MSASAFCAHAEKLVLECIDVGLLKAVLAPANDEDHSRKELRKSGRLEFGKLLDAARKDQAGQGNVVPAADMTAEDESRFSKVCAKFLSVSKINHLFDGLGLVRLLDAQRFRKSAEKRRRHAVEVLLAELIVSKDAGEHRWLARDLLSTILALVVMDIESIGEGGGDDSRPSQKLPPKAPRTLAAHALKQATKRNADDINPDASDAITARSAPKVARPEGASDAIKAKVAPKAAQAAVAWMAHKAISKSKSLIAPSNPELEGASKAGGSLRWAMAMKRLWMTGKGRKPKLPPAIEMDVPAKSIAWKAVKMTNTGKFYVFKHARPCGEIVRYAVSVRAACNHYEDAARIARICFVRIQMGASIAQADELRQSLYRLCYLRRVANGSMQAIMERRGRGGRGWGRGQARGGVPLPANAVDQCGFAPPADALLELPVQPEAVPQLSVAQETPVQPKALPEPDASMDAQAQPLASKAQENCISDPRRLEILANIIGELPSDLGTIEPVAAGGQARVSHHPPPAAAEGAVRPVMCGLTVSVSGQRSLQPDNDCIVEQFRLVCDGQEATTLSLGSVDAVQKSLEARLGLSRDSLEPQRGLIADLLASESARRLEAVQDSVMRLVARESRGAEEGPPKSTRLVRKSQDPALPILPPLVKLGCAGELAPAVVANGGGAALS